MKLSEILHDFCDNYRNKVRFLHLCNYLLFTVFCFCFLRGLQSDLVSFVLVKKFHLPYIYQPTLFSLLITGILLGVKFLINHFLRLKGRRHALAFLPSFILLAYFTSPVAKESLSHLLPFLIAAMVFVVLVLVKHRGFHTYDNFWSLSIPNLLCMLGGLLFVTFFSNTNDIFHYELNAQRHIIRGKYETALKVGVKSLATSNTLTALRAYALAQTGQLGEKLFEYPIPQDEKNLFINEKEAAKMLFQLKDTDLFKEVNQATDFRTFLHSALQDSLLIKERSQLAEYWLCTLLLEKKLDRFAFWFLKIHPAKSNETIPKHYREALVLYRTLTAHPRLIYSNVLTEQNYRDFNEVYDKYTDPTERNNYTRRLYGNTYFWYYFFH